MSADALFVGWGEVAKGREQLALEVFQEAVAFWGGHQSDGRIESFEPVLLTPHGGDLNGFFLVRGPRASISEILDTPEFIRLNQRVNAVVSGSGVIPAYVGDGVAEVMGVFGEVGGDLPQG
jgi:hypothetical protein